MFCAPNRALANGLMEVGERLSRPDVEFDTNVFMGRLFVRVFPKCPTYKHFARVLASEVPPSRTPGWLHHDAPSQLALAFSCSCSSPDSLAQSSSEMASSIVHAIDFERSRLLLLLSQHPLPKHH